MLRLQSLMRIHFSQLWLTYERQPHTCFPLNFCQSKFIAGAIPMHLDLMPTLQQNGWRPKGILPALCNQPVCHLVCDAASSTRAEYHLADWQDCPNDAGFGRNHS